MRPLVVIAAVAAVVFVVQADARHRKSFTVAVGDASGGGTFRLAAFRKHTPRDVRTCLTLTRRYRSVRRVWSFCPRGVPDTWAAHADSVFDCRNTEMRVVGVAAADVARVDVELMDGQVLPAALYRVPLRFELYGGRFFVLLTRQPWAAGSVTNMNPRAVRAFDSAGELVGLQRFSRSGGQSYDCFTAPSGPQIQEERNSG